jgi:hypothetical protein
VQSACKYLKELVPGAQRMALLFDKEYADACRLELDQIRDSPSNSRWISSWCRSKAAERSTRARRVRQSKPQALMSPVSGTFEIDAIKIGRFIREQKLPRSSSRSRPRNTVRFFRMARTILGITARCGVRRADPQGYETGRPAGRAPTRYDLIVNLRVAKELGIRVPETLLLQATRVIE